MRMCNVQSVIAMVALAIGLTPVTQAGESARRGRVHPAGIRRGNAVTPTVAGPNYGLFSCQVGLSPDVCYDPYQVRRAYKVDTLIANGFDGKGRTIVIVDAFQAPHIVQQLNTFDTFYGLPGLNGLGGPPNANLGTFTQIAPDGLTPFVSGDENMTGWAAEISLDVLWAHAIAPGANIVLVLAKSNEDADS